ncbi:unnamed protein product [Effrenium voratum]|nr:unnamed protein product [Effrenium voratum]
MAVLGCVQIPSDVTLEDEGPPFARKLGLDLRMVKVHFDSDDICASTYLRAMEREELTKAAQQLPQQCSVVGLSCTSYSFTLGSEKVREQLNAGLPDVPATNMADAQLLALKALNVRKVALLTPYIEELSVANAAMLESSGLEVVKRITMNLPTDELTSALTPPEIAQWALRVDVPCADCVVIGCSALRACQENFLDDLEAQLGKPVVTSTQAFLWRMARLAGATNHISGYGRLLSAC